MHDLKHLDGPMAGLDEFDELLSLENQWEEVMSLFLRLDFQILKNIFRKEDKMDSKLEPT
jgi:hypothetical protein